MYEFLIFDADHTLFDFNRAEKNAIIRVLNETGQPYKDVLLELYKNVNTSLWKKFEKNEITQIKIKTERFRLFFEKAGIKCDYQKASDSYLKYLSQGCYVLPGSEELIFNLKDSYLLGLLTNGISTVQHPRLENSVFKNVFDAVVVSGDVGVNKPDPKIFQLLTDKAKFFNKEKMLIIGDSLTSDMQGGMNFGIDTCWYNPHGKYNETKVHPTYEISKLDELYGILGQGRK